MRSAQKTGDVRGGQDRAFLFKLTIPSKGIEEFKEGKERSQERLLIVLMKLKLQRAATRSPRLMDIYSGD